MPLITFFIALILPQTGKIVANVEVLPVPVLPIVNGAQGMRQTRCSRTKRPLPETHGQEGTG